MYTHTSKKISYVGAKTKAMNVYRWGEVLYHLNRIISRARLEFANENDS